MNTPPFVLVTWEDAATTDGWVETPGFEPKEEICHTAGFLIYQSNARISIAGTWGGNVSNGIMTIPRGMIRSLQNIEAPIPATFTEIPPAA